MTFGEQADRYLARITRANTLATYRSILNSHVLPALGDVPLSEVGNAAAKQLAGRLTEAGLGPATIRLAVTLVKQIVKSAVDAEGNVLYPRTWNDAFIGLPAIIPAKQKAPIAPRQAVQEAITDGSGEVKALIGLLAGSGLRIGEALAVSTQDDGVANFWNPAKATILIRATRVRGELQPAPKTESGNREVNLDPRVNDLLAGLGRTGLLFPSGNSTYRRRFLALGLDYGFHGLRRFRVTHLEDAGVARMLVKYWTGHAAGDITERYIKFGPRTEERKLKAVEAGLGFEL